MIEKVIHHSPWWIRNLIFSIEIRRTCLYKHSETKIQNLVWAHNDRAAWASEAVRYFLFVTIDIIIQLLEPIFRDFRVGFWISPHLLSKISWLPLIVTSSEKSNLLIQYFIWACQIYIATNRLVRNATLSGTERQVAWTDFLHFISEHLAFISRFSPIFKPDLGFVGDFSSLSRIALDMFDVHVQLSWKIQSPEWFCQWFSNGQFFQNCLLSSWVFVTVSFRNHSRILFWRK